MYHPFRILDPLGIREALDRDLARVARLSEDQRRFLSRLTDDTIRELIADFGGSWRGQRGE